GQENRRFAVALSLFPPAIGSGAILDPCRSPPLGASLRLAPACGQRFGDFQPDTDVAVNLLFLLSFIVALIFCEEASGNDF
ncbi:hypothetical protein MXM41_10890, partial [Leclercia adecarboxylata]|nr:hypothetical protein [Leclercia adecarboxylata]